MLAALSRVLFFGSLVNIFQRSKLLPSTEYGSKPAFMCYLVLIEYKPSASACASFIFFDLLTVRTIIFSHLIDILLNSPLLTKCSCAINLQITTNTLFFNFGIIINSEHHYFCASTNNFTCVRELVHAQHFSYVFL